MILLSINDAFFVDVFFNGVIVWYRFVILPVATLQFLYEELGNFVEFLSFKIGGLWL